MSSTWSSSQSLLRAKLREARESANLTQVQIAEKLGKPQSYVSKVESGERNIDFIETRDYCRACGKDFGAFVMTIDTLLNKQ
jgi:transcriptional regulator with XRE-family HTH domain